MIMNVLHIYGATQDADGIERLAAFLKRKLGHFPALQIQSVTLRDGDAPRAIPAALAAQLQRFGARCLPAIVVDGTLVSQGVLPNFLDALDLVQRAEPTDGAPPPQAQSAVGRLWTKIKCTCC
jgi:hypothetical protein